MSKRTGRNVLVSIKSVDPTDSRNNIASALNDIVTVDQTTKKNPPRPANATAQLQNIKKIFIPTAKKEKNTKEKPHSRARNIKTKIPQKN